MFHACCSSHVCEARCDCSREAHFIASHCMTFVIKVPRRLFTCERNRTRHHMVSPALVRQHAFSKCSSANV